MKRPTCVRKDCDKPVDFVVRFTYADGGSYWWEPGICEGDREWLVRIVPELRLTQDGSEMPPIVAVRLVAWDDWVEMHKGKLN